MKKKVLDFVSRINNSGMFFMADIMPIVESVEGIRLLNEEIHDVTIDEDPYGYTKLSYISNLYCIDGEEYVEVKGLLEAEGLKELTDEFLIPLHNSELKERGYKPKIARVLTCEVVRKKVPVITYEERDVFVLSYTDDGKTCFERRLDYRDWKKEVKEAGLENGLQTDPWYLEWVPGNE